MRARSVLIPCLLIMLATVVHADSGVVRASEIDGPWRLTVFSEPTPLRAGRVDLSVLVQGAEDDEPILDAVISLLLEHADEEVDSLLIEATREAATNRLLYSAEFELPEPGPWLVHASAMRGDDVARIAFGLDAGEPLPPILDLWVWLALPAIAIVLVAINQWLQRRHRIELRETVA